MCAEVTASNAAASNDSVHPSSAADAPAAATNIVDAAANNIVTVEMLEGAVNGSAAVQPSDAGAAAAGGAVDTAPGSSDGIPDPHLDSVLVRVELSESLREDGRLLRMFVSRGEHLKPEARDIAMNNWLIPTAFYDKWIEAFVANYGRTYETADLQERSSELEGTCRGILASKANVAALEAKLATSGKDVFQLRDTLLAAAKDLSGPRRITGQHCGTPMPPEAIEALKLQRQIRLRNVVLACLRGIYASGVGGEVLRIATESAKNMIERFEARQDEVCTARQGHQWHEMKVLLDEIENTHRAKAGLPALTNGASSEPLPALTDGADDAEKNKAQITKREGKGTKFLLDKALGELGGEASSRDLISWVEANPDFTEAHTSIRINRNLSKRGNGEIPIWHRTLMSVLSCHFTGARRNSKGFVWRSRNTEPQPSIADDEDDDALPALAAPPPAPAADQAIACRSAAKPRARKKIGPLDLTQGSEAGPEAGIAEGGVSQVAPVAGRGKRKATKKQEAIATPTGQAESAPRATEGPESFDFLGMLDDPEEPKAKRVQPRRRAAASAGNTDEGPQPKRLKKAASGGSFASDPRSLALDAAISAASAS